MFRVFCSANYNWKLNKLDRADNERVIGFEQSLKTEPYSGKPLGYKFFMVYKV